ncbi:MAG: hypothetical protein SFW08_14795 [Gemmatimonadaceae bacterium]|nr:hypothetical protein [Gemmatimonadaceae bacterium]
MIASLLRLFALRPLLGAAIMGIPVLLLIALGLAVVWLFKFVLYVVLPISLAIWLFRKLSRSSSAPA